MNHKFFICFILVGFFTKIKAGTYSVGAAGTYTTLSAAFTDINNGVITGAITLNVISNTTEPAVNPSVVLNANGSGSANYSSVLIQPGGGSWTISGNVNGIFIKMNGASNVTFDGLNLGGNPSLTIENTSILSNSNISTIDFVLGANNCIVRNCTVKGSGRRASPTPTGTILLSTGTNHDILIYNCTLTTSSAGTLPFNPIACLANNYNVTVSYCNIQDFNNAASTRNSFGINVNSPGPGTIGTGGTQSWVIDHNNFFQTGARTSNASGTQHGCIYFSNTTPTTFGIDITNNVIGRTSTVGTMDMTIAYTGADGYEPYFLPIYINDLASGTTTNIKGNTIAGISFTTTSGGGTGGGSYWFSSDAPGIFTGITVHNAAGSGTTTPTVNIGGTASSRSDGNTIGLSAYPINVTSSSGNSPRICGIWPAFKGTCNIQDNTVSAMRLSKTGAGSMYMYGIALGNANPYAPSISGYCTGNKIYDLDFLSGTAGFITGIEQLTSDNIAGWTVANNMISLTSSYPGVWLIGLYDASQGPDGSINNYYFNSVYIGGVGTAGTTSNGFLSTNAGGSEENLTLKNNIFYMDRTTAGTSYCIEYSSGFPPWPNSTWSSNHNIFINTQNATQIGASGGSMTFAQWKTNSGGDANSYSGITPIFFNNVSTGDLHIIWDMSTVYPGTSLAVSGSYPLGIDYDTQNRNNPPDIGADEYGSVLPVELVSFSGSCDENKIKLVWQTASEFNNDYFEIQRKDGIVEDWKAVGTVKGTGNSSVLSNYEFIDDAPGSTNQHIHQSTIYYRLKQTDHDGMFTYSPILSVQFPCRVEIISVFPNPTSGNFLVTGLPLNTELSVADVLGEIVFQTTTNSVQETVNLNVPEGIFFVNVQTAQGSVVKKIVISK